MEKMAGEMFFDEIEHTQNGKNKNRNKDERVVDESLRLCME